MNWKQLARAVVDEVKAWADERFADVAKVRLLVEAEVRTLADTVKNHRAEQARLEHKLAELAARPAPTVTLDGVPAMVTAAVDAWFKANPPPIPKDGTSVDVEDLQPFLQAGLAKWQLEFERHASGVFQTWLSKLQVPQPLAPTAEQVREAVAVHIMANPPPITDAILAQLRGALEEGSRAYIAAQLKLIEPKRPTPEELLEAVATFAKDHPPPMPTEAELAAAAGTGFREAAAEWLEKHPPRGPTPEEIARAVEAYVAAHPAPARGPTVEELRAAVEAHFVENPVPELDADAVTKATLELVEATAERWLAEHPAKAGEPGPGPTAEAIGAAVAEHLEKHPPAAGRPPSVEEIAAAVDVYLAAHPPAAGTPGDKGDQGDGPTDEQVARVVADYLDAHPPASGEKGDEGPPPSDERVASAVADFLERFPAPAGRAPTEAEVAKAVEAYLAAHPPAEGPPPSAAALEAAVAEHLKAHPIPVPANGADASDEQVAAAVGAYLKAHPPADGRNVTDDEVAGAIAAYVAAHPIPHGKDGASVTLADVTPWLEQHGAQWALEFERRAQDLLRAVADKIPLPADGKDGLRVTDLKLEMSDDGRTLVVILEDGERRHVAQVRGKWPIYRGVFSDSTKYVEGDCVTFGGSMWSAVKDDPVGRPGSVQDWKLSVKHGRDAPKKPAP